MPRRRKPPSDPPVEIPTYPVYPGDPGAIGVGPGGGDPFPPLDNADGLDEAAAIAAEENADNRVDLSEHEPPPIGGGGYGSPPPLGTGYAGYGGYGEPPPSPGRPTSPTMWASAHLHDSIPQIRVWKRVNGVLILVGEIDAKANEEEFIRHFYESMPKPGEGTASFVIRPIDMNGREVREEITLPPISEHHTTLRQVRAVLAGSAGVAPAAALDLNPLHALIARSQEIADRQVQAALDEAKAERLRTAELQAKLVEQQVEVAGRAAMATEAITERMLKAESDRAERVAASEAARNDRALEIERTRATESVQTTSGMFTQLTTMQQQAWDRERTANEARMREESDRRQNEREEAKARLDRERLEWEQRRDREKAEDDRKWQREKLDREEHSKLIEGERQRQHEVRMKELDVQATRDREHAERMAALLKTEHKAESVEGIIEKGTKLLALIGMKPTDVLDMLTKPKEEGPNPLIELGMGALKEGMKVAGEYVRGNAQIRAQAQAAAGGQGAPGFGMVPAGYLPPPAGYPGVFPMAPGEQPEGVPVGPGSEMFPPAGDQPAAQAAPVEPGSDLPLTITKPARRAIRDLVGKLRGSPQDQWAELVATAIANELAIYHYVKEVSLRYALHEAGADEAFVTAFFAHPACALIPAEVPRG